MTRASYSQSLLMTAVSGLALALLIWLVFGPDLFGFYGLAAIAALLSLVVGWLMIKRRSHQKLSRWPVLVFIIPVLTAAITQIAYWVMFFATPGSGGITLGVVRTMFLENAGPLMPWAFAILAAFALWLLAQTLAPD